MMKSLFSPCLLLPVLLLYVFALPAQDLSHRYKFAKAYFGLDANIVPGYGGGTFVDAEGELKAFDRKGFAVPAINFGATHFWGHADFYVSITTVPLGGEDQPVETKTLFGAFTGMRLYPWKSKVGSIRPYLGYKFSPIRYRQGSLTDGSFQRTSVRGVLDIGLTYQSKRNYFYLGYNRLLNDEVEIPIARDRSTQTSLPGGFFTFGANWTMETTYNGDRKGITHFNETFDDARRFGWFLAIGPSSAFPTQKSDYFTGDRGFLDDLAMANILPDLAAGFHFLPFDANVALSFRPIVQERSAGNFKQSMRRTSLALETYKFLGDYHGFVPFVGLGLGYERMRLTETDGEIKLTDAKETAVSPLLVFGWDIRPSRKGDAWLLRTNLRYTPFLEFEHDGRAISLQQLEFNFIQLVVFPARLRAYKSYYRKG